VKTVSVTTTPQSLPSSGGSVLVQATVLDDGGTPLPGIPVTFATDKGSVSPSTATTDASGVATATLTTTATSKVKATAGTVTSTEANVTLAPFGLQTFTASPTATSAGVPVTFTVTPAAGANIQNVRVDFGDGNSRNLGSIAGPQTVATTYCSPGNYTATATVTDAAGGTGSLSTSVIVGALSVTLASTPLTPTVGSPVTFTANVAGSPLIDHFSWTWDDGTPQQTTTGPQNPHTFGSRGIKNVRVDVNGIGGCKIGTAALTLDVQ
jgi:PKD repeat protein